MKLYKIKKSKIDNKGRGLYATKDIKSGTKIINYIGKILTNKEVDDDLYEHLDHQPKEYWHGLSGKAYPFKPGNVLKFDAKSIHGTSNMTCEYKLGLTIRLDIPFN